MTDEEIKELQQLSNGLIEQVKVLEQQINELLKGKELTSIEIHAQSLGEALEELNRKHEFFHHLYLSSAILNRGEYTYSVVTKPSFKTQTELIAWLNEYGARRFIYITGLLTIETEQQIVFVKYNYNTGE